MTGTQPDISDALDAALPDSKAVPAAQHGTVGRLPPEDSARITRRITAISVCVGLVLALGKGFLWDHTHSVGVLSSFVHSALDMFGAISTFIAVRFAAKPPDNIYRYGRGKAESFSAIFQVCLVIFAGVHLLEEAAHRFAHPEPIEQAGFALTVMLGFTALTVWLLIAQSWAIRATGSLAVKGDRAHYFADMLSNFVVIIGLVLASTGQFERADAFVGGLIALWLFWTAFKIAQLAWSQLLDCELPEEDRQNLKAVAMENPMVHDVKDLRTRASGPHVHIQMRLDLDDSLSLQRAHDIILDTERRLMEIYKAADILIHPHPIGCQHTHGNVRFREDIVRGDEPPHSHNCDKPH